jgi:hypothetical protein
METTSVWNLNRSAPAFSSAFERGGGADVPTEMRKRLCRSSVADFIFTSRVYLYVEIVFESRILGRIRKPKGGEVTGDEIA